MSKVCWCLQSSTEDVVVKRRSDQRFAAPGEPTCAICGRFGAYICDEVCTWSVPCSLPFPPLNLHPESYGLLSPWFWPCLCCSLWCCALILLCVWSGVAGEDRRWCVQPGVQAWAFATASWSSCTGIMSFINFESGALSHLLVSLSFKCFWPFHSSCGWFSNITIECGGRQQQRQGPHLWHP